MSVPSIMGRTGECPSSPPWKPTKNLRKPRASASALALDGTVGIASKVSVSITPSMSLSIVQVRP